MQPFFITVSGERTDEIQNRTLYCRYDSVGGGGGKERKRLSWPSRDVKTESVDEFEGGGVVVDMNYTHTCKMPDQTRPDHITQIKRLSTFREIA